MEFLPYPHLIPTLFNGCGFGPPLPLTAASTWTWIDHPVSGLPSLTLALLRLGFPTAPVLKTLTLPVSATRRTVLQKVRGRAYKALPQLVDTGFQVLFHSPPGVLFTFPSQYYALSVTKWYLALGGGPPDFPQGFSCPAVLWILPAVSAFHLHDFHVLRSGFPSCSIKLRHCFLQSATPTELLPSVWPLSISLATTLEISVDFFSSPYLDVSVREVPLIYLLIQYMIHELLSCGLLHSDICGS